MKISPDIKIGGEMAKRKRENNEKRNEKKRKEGRGEGKFENYKPWLKIQDVATEGLATRIKGTKTGRSHQLLSTLELNYFYVLDWCEDVVDIREQYPLDLSETVAIAREVNIPHPPRSEPNNPSVITTDFLITIRQPIGTKEVARTIKPSESLTNSRVLEKFEIERLYWQERNIDWGIVTELDINKTLVKNLIWLYRYIDRSLLPPTITITLAPKLIKFMLPIIKKKSVALRDVTNCCDGTFGLPCGNSLSLVRHLLATRKWEVDLLKPIQIAKPLNLQKFRS